jgi:hypothetical protein
MRESNIAAIIERDLLRADDGKPSDVTGGTLKSLPSGPSNVARH